MTMQQNTGAAPMLDRLIFDQPWCSITDCTTPPVDDLCEAHGGGQ